MDFDMTKVLIIVVELIGAILTTILIPWIRTKMTNEQMKNLESWVKIGVAAAEQLFPREQREEKKAYVVNFLHEKGLKFNEEDIDKAIEAEVLRLHNELGV